MKEDIAKEKLKRSVKLNAIDYINSVTDKVQRFTAEKIEKAEDKIADALDETKDIVVNSTESISNAVKNSLDK
jgi:urease gamma subunit